MTALESMVAVLNHRVNSMRREVVIHQPLNTESAAQIQPKMTATPCHRWQFHGEM